MNEPLVVQGLREGKTEAWQALYDAYAEPVWHSVARLLGGSSADIGDVVQETMLAAARSAATFDPQRGSLWFWLWGIARRQAALHFRKQDRLDRLRKSADANGQLLRWLEEQQPAPPDALADAELVTLVRATLLELPADYEMLLTAKYLDGEPVAAIADRERSSESAIRSKLARAREAFRHAFARFAGNPAGHPQEAHHEPT